MGLRETVEMFGLTCINAVSYRPLFESPFLQRRGRRFEPVTAHKANDLVIGCFRRSSTCERVFERTRNPTKIQARPAMWAL